MELHAWTSNKVPHFGNSEQYKTEKELEREFYEKQLEELKDD